MQTHCSFKLAVLGSSLICLSMLVVNLPTAFAGEGHESKPTESATVAAPRVESRLASAEPTRAIENKEAAVKEAPAASADPLQKLKDGNARYVSQKFLRPDQSIEQRIKVAMGQKPFAIVLGCSDSRVPPELIFDQGIGDLFVIRVAGNIVDPVVLASVEYAASHLNCPLVVVLGHERCGAVHAAVLGGESHGHLSSILEPLAPSVAQARNQEGDLVDNAVRANIKRMTQQLRSSKPVLDEMVTAGKLKIIGARFDLDTGAVEWTQ